MPKFRLDEDRLSRSLVLPDSDYFKSLILENNTKFTIFKDPLALTPIVECENKPRNSQFFGIHWIEVND